ncbi:O-antigen ligase family protein [Candidatus Sumerlaeota bacterium]|nr:O-antigen ligase family protein [Candidatus Sumerlaeota bacterium]
MYTLFRSFQYLVFFGLIVDTTWHQRSVDRMAKLLAIYGLILIVFFQIADLSVNAFAMRERIGPHVSPTSGVVFFLGLALRGPGWRALVYLSLLSVAIGQSAGTNVSMAAGLFVLALIGRDQKLRLASLTILMLFSLLALVRSEFAGSVLFPQKGTQAIYTMSGRIPVWQWFLWDIFPKRPWVGYAFGTGESVSRLENVRGLQMTHMHNPLISALANLGSIGGLVYLVTMFSTASVAIHITNSRWKGPVCAAITLITLNSQQGVSISSTVSTAWITSCLLLALLSTTPQEARSGQESLLRRKDQTGCFRRA